MSSSNFTKWTRLLGSSSFDQGNALTTGCDGSIFIAGNTNGDLDGQTNIGYQDAFLTKLTVPTESREERSVLLSNDLNLSSISSTHISDDLKMGSTSDGVYKYGAKSTYTFENGKISDLKFSVQGKNSFHDVIVDVMEEGDPTRLPTLDIYLTDSNNGDAYFLQDTYNDYFGSLETQTDAFGRSYTPRYQNINALYAGKGDDLIDMTSTESRTLYDSSSRAGGGIATVYAGEGNDSILGSDGTVYGGDGDDTLIAHHNSSFWGGEGADVFGFLANPVDSITGSALSPEHQINDFESGIDKIIFYHKSSHASQLAVTRTEDDNIQWQYWNQGASSTSVGLLTLNMNGETWTESDIEFALVDPVIL